MPDPYYDGAKRMMLGGVPCRVPNPPISKAGIALYKSSHADFNKHVPIEPWQAEEAYLRAMGRL